MLLGQAVLPSPSRVVHLRNVPNDMTEVELLKLCISSGTVTNYLFLKGKNQVDILSEISSASGNRHVRQCLVLGDFFIASAVFCVIAGSELCFRCERYMMGDLKRIFIASHRRSDSFQNQTGVFVTRISD